MNENCENAVLFEFAPQLFFDIFYEIMKFL